VEDSDLLRLNLTNPSETNQTSPLDLKVEFEEADDENEVNKFQVRLHGVVALILHYLS
jgi:hypothetical protein